MATCEHYDILTDPATKTPYKHHCPTELHESSVKKGARYCLKHRQNVSARPRGRGYKPLSEDVRSTPRYDGEAS